ncbi:MAG: class I SAM-dependent methyltransferase [Nitrospirota bacterium]
MKINLYNEWDNVPWETLQPNYGRYRISNLLNLIPLEGLHLDIGTGRGDGTELINQIKKTVAIDYGIKSCRIAKSKGLQILQSDAHFLPFKDKVFLSITCTDVLEHIPNAGPVLKEAYRVLMDNGVVILQTPNRELITEVLLRIFRRFGFMKSYQPYDIPYSLKEIKNMAKEANFILERTYITRHWVPNPIYRIMAFSRVFILKK